MNLLFQRNATRTSTKEKSSTKNNSSRDLDEIDRLELKKSSNKTNQAKNLKRNSKGSPKK